MADRYALCFAPHAGSALWAFGSAMLGYDAQTGAELAQPVLPHVSPERLRRLTAGPRRYGFHATLKAPFKLAEGACEEDLVAALDAFCAGRRAFTLSPLAVDALSRPPGDDAFLALVEATPSSQMAALERDVVHVFERWRAPATDAEIARRKPETLTERQRGHLARFGYPYVLEDFRFHLTLTGPVTAADRESLRRALADLHARHVPATDVPVDQLALFRQRPGERFRILRRTLFV